MKHTPLDEQLYNENERPAGPWLEAYWQHAAVWAKRLAAIIALHLCYQAYVFSDFPVSSLIATRGLIILIFAWLLPLGIMSYFIFQFGRLVSFALEFKDQRMFEEGLHQLRYVIFIALVVAGITLLQDLYATFMLL